MLHSGLVTYSHDVGRALPFQKIACHGVGLILFCWKIKNYLTGTSQRTGAALEGLY